MPDDPGVPDWEQRFRAPTLTFPTWARHAPDRLAVATNETGSWQVYGWDRAAGTRRRMTDVDIGVPSGLPTPDGEGVVWFDDATGDEVGHWVVQPFDGGEPRPLAPGVPDAWSAGLALASPGIAIVGTADAGGYTVYRSGEVIHRHRDTVIVRSLSWDGTRLCIAHAEHGDTQHLALRVLDAATAQPVGDLWDGEGFGLHAAAWAPGHDDHRLAIVSERTGTPRPGVWDLDTGERDDIDLDLAGVVTVAGWWPDADALLLVHTFEGRDRLLRYDLSTGSTTALDHPEGSVLGAGVRPDGDVWLLHASGATPPILTTSAGDEPLTLEAETTPPPGHPYRSWHFDNPRGHRVHGFLATPATPPPHPLVMLVHGGPHAQWEDTWRPDVAAWVDHGFAVALVNYRGSTGYGTAWRDALRGDPGFPELEDVVAGVDDLIATDRVDPHRVVLAGGSWGGYITLLGLGRQPDRWAAGVAAVPVADYVAAFEDEAPGLQAMDRELFGGEPADVPDLYAERSPITYVDRVTAPVLIIAGDNDTRCPIRQILNYVARLEARGGEHDVYRYEAGHGSMVVDERVRQMRIELAFVLKRVQPD